jgi:hypothetical protein
MALLTEKERITAIWGIALCSLSSSMMKAVCTSEMLVYSETTQHYPHIQMAITFMLTAVRT